MFKVLLASSLVLMASCRDGDRGQQGPQGEKGVPGQPCSTSSAGGDITIACPGSDPVVVHSGANGKDGQNGQSGSNGYNVGISVDSADSSLCTAGGWTYTTWSDANGNGKFDPGEPNYNQKTVCSGSNGQNGSSGHDGSNGNNGWNIGMSVDPADGTTCPYGGWVYTTWYDVNNNGKYDQGEPGYSQHNVCNGGSGHDGQNGSNGHDGHDGHDGQGGQNGTGIGYQVGAATPDTCPYGGWTYTSWYDANGNGSYDPGETGYNQRSVCNGGNGQNGRDGQNGQNGQNGQSCSVIQRADGAIVIACPGSADQTIPPERTVVICQTVNGRYVTKTYKVSDFVADILGKVDYYYGSCH